VRRRRQSAAPPWRVIAVGCWQAPALPSPQNPITFAPIKMQQGLEVVAFPCNQFGRQESGSPDQIRK
jgi:hypothetical protein